METEINFIEVKSGESEKIEELSVLASGIVKEHYDPIIGPQQNDYMIKKFQSVNGINEQLAHGYNYFFIVAENKKIGFTAFYKRDNEMYISKLYLKKEERGKGYSKQALAFVIRKAKECNADCITLNVNKKNGSIAIYQKLGFTILKEEVNDIGNGFVMDDYVMIKAVGDRRTDIID